MRRIRHAISDINSDRPFELLTVGDFIPNYIWLLVIYPLKQTLNVIKSSTEDSNPTEQKSRLIVLMVINPAPTEWIQQRIMRIRLAKECTMKHGPKISLASYTINQNL